MSPPSASVVDRVPTVALVPPLWFMVDDVIEIFVGVLFTVAVS